MIVDTMRCRSVNFRLVPLLALLMLPACATTHELIERGRTRAACEQLQEYYRAGHENCGPPPYSCPYEPPRLSEEDLARFTQQLVAGTRGTITFHLLSREEREAEVYWSSVRSRQVIRIQLELDRGSFVASLEVHLDPPAIHFDGDVTSIDQDYFGKCGPPPLTQLEQLLFIPRLLSFLFWKGVELTISAPRLVVLPVALLDAVTQPLRLLANPLSYVLKETPRLQERAANYLRILEGPLSIQPTALASRDSQESTADPRTSGECAAASRQADGLWKWGNGKIEWGGLSLNNDFGTTKMDRPGKTTTYLVIPWTQSPTEERVHVELSYASLTAEAVGAIDIDIDHLGLEDLVIPLPPKEWKMHRYEGAPPPVDSSPAGQPIGERDFSEMINQISARWMNGTDQEVCRRFARDYFFTVDQVVEVVHKVRFPSEAPCAMALYPRTVDRIHWESVYRALGVNEQEVRDAIDAMHH